MRQREFQLRAERVGGKRTKTRTSPSGRTCEVCDQVLSIYNHELRCWVHRRFHRFRVRGA